MSHFLIDAIWIVLHYNSCRQKQRYNGPCKSWNTPLQSLHAFLVTATSLVNDNKLSSVDTFFNFNQGCSSQERDSCKLRLSRRNRHCSLWSFWTTKSRINKRTKRFKGETIKTIVSIKLFVILIAAYCWVYSFSVYILCIASMSRFNRLLRYAVKYLR